MRFAEAVELWGRGVKPVRVRWHFAEGTDPGAVPVEFVDVVDVTNEDGEIEIGIGCGVDSDVPAIPGVPGVVEVLLGAPGLVGLDGLPGGVVEGRGGPGGIVAGVELPCAVQGSCGYA